MCRGPDWQGVHMVCRQELRFGMWRENRPGQDVHSLLRQGKCARNVHWPYDLIAESDEGCGGRFADDASDIWIIEDVILVIDVF